MNYLLRIASDEKITSILPMPKESKSATALSLMMVTKLGTAKKVKADSFHEVRLTGLIAITLEAGDELMSASISSTKATTCPLSQPKVSQSDLENPTSAKRAARSMGVRGIKRLARNDSGHFCRRHQKQISKIARIMVISKNGYGKTTEASEYKTQNRGGTGILTMNVTDKTGPVISAKVITEEDSEVVAMSKKSQVVRVELAEIPTLSR